MLMARGCASGKGCENPILAIWKILYVVCLETVVRALRACASECRVSGARRSLVCCGDASEGRVRRGWDCAACLCPVGCRKVLAVVRAVLRREIELN